jgi:hypothetical protein
MEIRQKLQIKNILSLSQPMLKVPVNKGSRAFPAGAKGRKRFTNVSHQACESDVKRQKREKGLKSPVNREL